MKKAFQISRSVRFLSILVLVVFMVLLWGAENGKQHQNPSNSGTPSQSETNFSFAIFQDNNVFAILPDSSKVIGIYFHGIASFFQVRLQFIWDFIDGVRTPF